jgi:suppressor of ftsI
MKKVVLTFSLLALAACSQVAVPSDATDGEVTMAKMMGISVEELRNQTPEEHMQMMQKMMEGGNGMMHENTGMMMDGESEFLPGEQANLEALPERTKTKLIEMKDGDSMELNPTLIRSEINGKEVAMYGYNGQIPGPTIKVPQGATITLLTTNKIDMDTTIHSHGVRLDNANDGVPGVTQETILPNGTFEYTIRFPDEGVYWYHPHVREDIQQDMGLYGNYIVTPANEDAYAPVNQEEVLVLDDILLDNDGMPTAYGKADATFPLMGRFGNHMLVNGQPAEEYSLQVQQASVVRFYITNVANTRTFNMNFGGAQMKLVGSDVGRYEKEEWVNSVTIAPAERYIVDVLFDAPNSTVSLMHMSPLASYNLGTVHISNELVDTPYIEEFGLLHTHKDVVEDILSYWKYFDKEVDKTLRLDIDMAAMDHGMMMEEHTDDGIEWEDSMPQMNAMMTKEQVQWKLVDEETNTENMDISWEFKVGDISKIRIVNDETSAHPMQHPIHFHGQRFLVLSMDGVPNENLVWKDTVLIPTGSTADLLFDMSNPGDWMFHCHIAEHLTNGMMGMFRVTK